MPFSLNMCFRWNKTDVRLYWVLHSTVIEDSPLPKSQKSLILEVGCTPCLTFCFWYHFVGNIVYFHNLPVAKLANFLQHLKFCIIWNNVWVSKMDIFTCLSVILYFPMTITPLKITPLVWMIYQIKASDVLFHTMLTWCF